jgi:hypothetical protein
MGVLGFSNVTRLTAWTALTPVAYGAEQERNSGTVVLSNGANHNWSQVSIPCDSDDVIDFQVAGTDSRSGFGYFGTSVMWLAQIEIRGSVEPYMTGDYVIHLGKLWFSTVDNNGSTPGSSTTWTELPLDPGSLDDLSDVDLTGAADGDTLVYNATAGLWSLADPTAFEQGPRTINAQTDTTYTLALSDADGKKFLTLSNASAITLTVPPNSSVAFPVGTVIALAQLGAGQVTITPGSGVTVNAVPGLKIAAQYGVAELLKIAADTWLAYGRLSA